MTSNIWRVRVLKADRPTNTDPIKMQAGDLLEIAGKEDDGWIWCRNRAGKEDWVPLSYMTAEGEGKTRIALTDYDSTVLSVEVGKSSKPNGKSMVGCGAQTRRENGGGYG
jgi:hypothetical protein